MRLVLETETLLAEVLERDGLVPLPPYIKRDAHPDEEDRKRYQTIYANQPGAVAAPTAGLHFTQSLLDTLSSRGIIIAPITLHVGYGTFAPVQTTAITEHEIHQEYIHIPDQTARKINTAKAGGSKVWAVGTTSVRALEFAADAHGTLSGVSGWCNLYITPGFEFKIVDSLVTNFHLPRSSLLFLVAALCGRIPLLAAYAEAIKAGYRFYSYGDAMAIVD